MRRFFLFLMGIFFSTHAFAEVDEAWLKLLNYEKVGQGFKSLVKNDDFFISPLGRYNPKEEYWATVRAFDDDKNMLKCDFPARFLYLKRKNEVKGDLSQCADYQKFIDDVQPDAVTLIFTNAYMNNPSSLFGHTLFRIDTKRKGTQLLAHGVNFGADTGDDSGVLYALKGLWGGYYGTFGVKPYWDVINLYNNIENRDIWEYELNLSDEELDFFVAHIWEMKKAKIRYYFFNKNCSYVVLKMIEAVKPELDLTSDFEWSAVPLATLKVVNSVKNLVKHTNYRPSRQSKLKYRFLQMNDGQRDVLRGIIKNGRTNWVKLKEEEKADVLETAYQYVQYQYIEGKEELEEYRKKSFSLLRERSKIANNRQYFDELKEGENPLYAHEMRSMMFGGGNRNGHTFQEVRFRPFYNSLTEDSFGLLKGAEIGFFNTVFRHYDDKNKYELNKIDFLSIKSLNGQDVMFKPFSYDIDVAYIEKFNPKTGESTGAFKLDLGVGEGVLLTQDLTAYVMSVPHALYGGGVKDNGYVGIGLKGGVYYNRDKVRLMGSVEKKFATSYWGDGDVYEFNGAYGLTRNLMVYADYKRFSSRYKDDEEMIFGIGVNF